MIRRFSVFAALLLVAWAGGACDDSGSRPSSGGGGAGSTATKPAPKPSPARDGAVAWARAVAAGDLEKAKALSVGSEQQMEGLEAYVGVGASEAKLNAATKEKFGGEHVGGILHDLPAKWAEADEQVTGDSVAFTHDSIAEPLVVAKQPDGTWKVELGDLHAGTVMFNNQSKSNDEVEADVRAGKITSAEDAWKSASAKTSARSGAPGGSGGPPGGGPGAK
jgi:hypothetical protein